MMGQQLSFDLLPRGNPTWEDAQKGRATWVPRPAYSAPCRASCLHADSVYGGVCYLFHKPVMGGMCPSTGSLEWEGDGPV